MAVRIINADVMDGLAQLDDESVHCCVTSPPYWGLRDYGVAGQIGLEPTPEAFVSVIVDVFAEVKRVLRKDGSLWINLGDSYASSPSGGDGVRSSGLQGSTLRQADFRRATKHKNVPNGLKPKDLVGIPWMVAFALRANGWYLRQEIIWAKPNPMPESVKDRCTKAHEHIFLLTKSERYFYDANAIAEPVISGFNGSSFTSASDFATKPGLGKGQRSEGDTRNKRSVWSIATQPYAEAHFATFPEELPESCIKAGCPVGGAVLDPFGGAGTTGLVADKLARNAILIELNPEYAAMAERRITNSCPLFASVSSILPSKPEQIDIFPGEAS